MSSFASHESDKQPSVSYHTDVPGVSMTRAKIVRAQPLDCSTYSPGPAAYYDKQAVKQSPMRSGIKFSLAKKPPGLFDIPDIQICPGPGAYDCVGDKKLGVAEFRSVRSSSSIIKPSGAVAVTTPHKLAVPSQYPTSATRRQVAPRSPRSTSKDESNVSLSGFLPPQSMGKVSDLSNASFGDYSTVQGDLQTDEGRSVSMAERSRPEDFGVDPRIINPKLWAKIRSRLTAASYTARGQNRPALFANSDKNHDGFLDLAEVKGMFRRVLKLPQDELSDKAIRHFFVALDTNRKGKLDFDHFFAFLNDNNEDQGVSFSNTSNTSVKPKSSRPMSSPQKSQQPPVKQSRQMSPAPQRNISSLSRASIDETTNQKEAQSPKKKLPGAITEALTDVERLRGDFDTQLEELGEMGKVIDKLISTMVPPNNNST